MDKILVTLLLIIIGLGVTGSLLSWVSTETDVLKAEANRSIERLINE